MQQDPIVEHGMLIDTYNYAAMINAAANQVSANSYYQVKSSRKSKIFKNKGRKKKRQTNKSVHRRMLKR